MMRKSESRRINWSISPHREKLAHAVDEWFATAASATTATATATATATNRRGSLGEFAETHGIPRTTLFKYVREDTSKRQLVAATGDSVTTKQPSFRESPRVAGRGKRRLLTRSEIQSIVAELQRRATTTTTAVATNCDDEEDYDEESSSASTTINNSRRGKRNRREQQGDGGILFSRKEAMQLLMEQFHLSRKAASRQLTRYILPEIMINATTNNTTQNNDDDDDRLMETRGGGEDNGLLGINNNDQGLLLLDDWEGQEQVVDDSMEEMEETKGISLHQQHQQQQQQHQHQNQNHDCWHYSRSMNDNDDVTPPICVTPNTIAQQQQTIVIINVTSPIGQALLKHYYHTGKHTVAGCGCDDDVIRSLQVLYPMAILTTVDITNDAAIRNWTTTNLVVVQDTRTNDNGGGGMTELLVIDVVIVVAAATATTTTSGGGVRWYTNNLPIWETSQKEFDTTIDNDIRGMANVIRHLIPRLINRSSDDRGGRSGGGGTFVAVVPSTTGLDDVSPHAANNTIIMSAYAMEGLIKSVANSIPDPLCAAILSPGLLLPYMDMDEEEEQQLRQHWTTKGDLEGGGDRGRDFSQWANVAGPMILKMSRRDNENVLHIVLAMVTCPMYIFTASASEHAQRCMNSIGIADLPFRGIIDTRTCKFETKHSRSSFHAAMATTNVSDPSFCVNIQNVIAAKEIHVGLHDRDTSALIKCNEADVHIASLHELQTAYQMCSSEQDLLLLLGMSKIC